MSYATHAKPTTANAPTTAAGLINGAAEPFFAALGGFACLFLPMIHAVLPERDAGQAGARTHQAHARTAGKHDAKEGGGVKSRPEAKYVRPAFEQAFERFRSLNRAHYVDGERKENRLPSGSIRRAFAHARAHSRTM